MKKNALTILLVVITVASVGYAMVLRNEIARQKHTITTLQTELTETLQKIQAQQDVATAALQKAEELEKQAKEAQ